MEWRLIGNIYRNELNQPQGDTSQTKILEEIQNLCVKMNNEIQKGLVGLGKPTPNLNNLTTYCSQIMKLYDELNHKPQKSNRTPRLVGITLAIVTGNHEGYLEDRNGNFPDWYVGL